jgi:hypothetical protein
MALCVSAPSFIVNDQKIFTLQERTLFTVCEEIWFSKSLKHLYHFVVIAFQYLFPLIIITLLNLRIFRFLKKSVPNIYSCQIRRLPMSNSYDKSSSNSLVTLKNSRKTMVILEPNQTQYRCSINNSSKLSNIDEIILVKSVKRYDRSKKILLFVALSFNLCWLPITILNAYYDLISPQHEIAFNPTIMFLICYLIALLSTCINPILYGLLNENFKEEIKRLFKKDSSRRKKHKIEH